MMITNRLEKNSILSALKVQLKRLSEDKKALERKLPVPLVLALNEEIARVESLILAFKEEL